jgi:8-oxo-dGTP pyrophosphatase MutT (NUDIX family)
MRTFKKLRDHLEMIGDEDKVETIVKVAAGIIMKEDENGTKKILLIQRAAEDHWPLHFEFPRGKCDKTPNEKIIPCLKREIKEETGLDVEPVEFLGKFEYLADQGKRRSICYNYLCEMKNPDQKVVFKKTPGGIIEHQGYKWITQAGEAELLVHPDQKRFIQQVLSTENPIVSTPENSFTKNNQIEETKKYFGRIK